MRNFETEKSLKKIIFSKLIENFHLIVRVRVTVSPSKNDFPKILKLWAQLMCVE